MSSLHYPLKRDFPPKKKRIVMPEKPKADFGASFALRYCACIYFVSQERNSDSVVQRVEMGSCAKKICVGTCLAVAGLIAWPTVEASLAQPVGSEISRAPALKRATNVHNLMVAGACYLPGELSVLAHNTSSSERRSPIKTAADFGERAKKDKVISVRSASGVTSDIKFENPKVGFIGEGSDEFGQTLELKISIGTITG